MHIKEHSNIIVSVFTTVHIVHAFIYNVNADCGLEARKLVSMTIVCMSVKQ